MTSPGNAEGSHLETPLVDSLAGPGELAAPHPIHCPWNVLFAYLSHTRNYSKDTA